MICKYCGKSKGGYRRPYHVNCKTSHNLLKEKVRKSLSYAICYGVKRNVSEEELKQVDKLLWVFIENKQKDKGVLK